MKSPQKKMQSSNTVSTDLIKNNPKKRARAEALLEDFKKNDNPIALHELFQLTYNDLKDIARKKLNTYYKNPSLESAEVVHKYYINEISKIYQINYNDLDHFLAKTTLAMIYLLIDYFRSRVRKETNQKNLESLDNLPGQDGKLTDEQNIIVLEAFDGLARNNPKLAAIAWLRYSGFKHEEIAAVMCLSLDQAKKRWLDAKSYLEDSLRNILR